MRLSLGILALSPCAKRSDLWHKSRIVPTIIVCEAGMFTRKIPESGVKLRFLTATLFRRGLSEIPASILL